MNDDNDIDMSDDGVVRSEKVIGDIDEVERILVEDFGLTFDDFVYSLSDEDKIVTFNEEKETKIREFIESRRRTLAVSSLMADRTLYEVMNHFVDSKSKIFAEMLKRESGSERDERDEGEKKEKKKKKRHAEKLDVDAMLDEL